MLDADRKPYASDAVIDLISAAFRMRRKTLVNNLTGWHGLTRAHVLDAMRRAGIDENARAEEVELAAFARLGSEV